MQSKGKIIKQQRYNSHRVLFVDIFDIAYRKWFIELIKALMSQGHCIFWASLDTGESSQLLIDGVNFYSVEFPRRILPFRTAIAALQLFWVIRSVNPNIIITASVVPSWLVRLICTFFQKPRIFYVVHSWFWDDRSPCYKRWFAIMLEWLVSWRTNHFIFINREDFNDGLAFHLCQKRNADCIDSLGIDLNVYDRKKITKERVGVVKRQLMFSGEINYIIGFVGRMVDYKGIVELARAFSQVRKSFPSAGLVYIGKTSAVERDQGAFCELQSYIIRTNLSSYVRIIPYVEDLPAMMALFDVLVLPSWYEGYGLVLLEAGAMGKPVVACNVRGVREAVIDGETGLLVPPQKVVSIAQAITLLLSNPSLRHCLGTRGQSYSQQYDRKDRVNRIIKILDRVCST